MQTFLLQQVLTGGESEGVLEKTAAWITRNLVVVQYIIVRRS